MCTAKSSRQLLLTKTIAESVSDAKALLMAESILLRSNGRINEPIPCPKQLFEAIAKDYLPHLKLLEPFIERSEYYIVGNDSKKGKCYDFTLREKISSIDDMEFVSILASSKESVGESKLERISHAAIKRIRINAKGVLLLSKADENKMRILVSTVITPTLIKESPKHIANKIGGTIPKEDIGYGVYFQDGRTYPIDSDNRKCRMTGRSAVKFAKTKDLKVLKYKENFVFTDSIHDFIQKKVLEIQYSALVSLNAIRTGQVVCKRNTTNRRLDTSLSNLSSLFEGYLVGEGEQLLGIDLANSQFLLFSHLVKNARNTKKPLFALLNPFLSVCFDATNSKGQKEKRTLKSALDAFIKVVSRCSSDSDLSIFIEKCEQGLIYDDFATKANISRIEAKQIFMFIAFSHQDAFHPKKHLFETIYPSVSLIFCNYKQFVGSQNLSIFLQNVESIVFIDTIVQSCQTKGHFVVSKHDSILYKKYEAVRMEKLLKSILDKTFGVGCYTAKRNNGNTL